MSLSGASQFAERIQFFNGQRLFASDLQALDAFHREMRWLHNQSLHQPGVGSGFAISGDKGARQVIVQPGYALDDLGREIVLTATHIEPVPPVANDGFGRSVLYDLTIAYPSESDLKETEVREGLCQQRGAVRLREEPVFCWVRLGPPPDRVPDNAQLRSDMQTGHRVRLARAEVLNCQLEQPLSLTQRRNARPPDRPYVACGGTDASGWTVKGPRDTFSFGYEVSRTVDTSAAGFRNTPRYLANVNGERRFTFTAVDGPATDVVLDGFLSVTAPAADSFFVTILIPQLFFDRLANLGPDDILQQLKTQISRPLGGAGQANNGNHWQVEWIGVEG
jgi:hypothetical protein